MSSLLVPLAQAADPVEAATTSGTAEAVLFWVFAAIAIGAGLAMLAMRNIVHAALMLVINFFAISALFLGLQSPFLSIVQIIVYAGAIMVLFLFVIMLLGIDRDDSATTEHVLPQVGAAVLAVLVTGAVLFGVMGTFTSDVSTCGDLVTAEALEAAEYDQARCVGLEDANAAHPEGSVGIVGERLFTRYTFAFELAAVLLTVATIGAMVLGRRKDVEQDEDSAWDTDVHLPSVADAEAILAGVGAADGDLAAEQADLDTTATGDVAAGDGPDHAGFDGPVAESDGPDEEHGDDSPYKDGGL